MGKLVTWRQNVPVCEQTLSVNHSVSKITDTCRHWSECDSNKSVFRKCTKSWWSMICNEGLVHANQMGNEDCSISMKIYIYSKHDTAVS